MFDDAAAAAAFAAAAAADQVPVERSMYGARLFGCALHSASMGTCVCGQAWSWPCA